MRVLITGGGGPGSEMLWKLWEKEHTIYFADQDISRIHPSIPIQQRVEVLPGIDSQFISQLVAASKDLAIDIIISQVDEELMSLAEHTKELAPTIFVSPQTSFIEIFLDKFRAGISLASKGIPEPETSLLTSKSRFGSGPILVKPRFGRGSRDIFTARSELEFEKLKEYLLVQKEEFICQSLKSGIEYSVQVMANSHGELKAIIPVRINAKRGSTTSGKVDNNNLVIDTCQNLHSKYLPTGTYNIQLILDELDGTAYTFELNPRVSTTMCLALFGGADPIENYFDLVSENSLKLVQNGLELQRYWINSVTSEDSI